MSSTLSDSEMSFDSEDSEIDFIRPWIRDSDNSRTGHVVRMSAEFITNDDEAAAYADDPLTDKEWTSNYQKYVDVGKKLDSMKTNRTDLKAT